MSDRPSEAVLATLEKISVPNTLFNVAEIAHMEGSKLVISVGYPIAQVKSRH